MTSSVLRVQHTSLQFSDSPKQQEHDIKLLFAKGKQCPIKTGTESGPDNANHDLMIKYAKENNHALHFMRSNWVAVDRAIIKKGSVRKGSVFVAPTGDVVGPGHDSAFATMAFTHVDPRIGRINQAAAHYPTKGAKRGSPNYLINRKYAELIAKWMDEVGKGTALAFVNGDFNMPDSTTDWSFNHGWTSMGDELKKHPNTGHGPIDGFASYDKDGRVKAKNIVALNDKQMPMHSDHYVVRGAWTIQHLKVKK